MFGVSSLNDYLFPARAQVAKMLGLNRDMPPQQRINQGFSAFPGADSNPPMDFNQSFGAAPFNTPQDRQAFLSKYMQGRPPAPQQPAPAGPGAPMDLSPPAARPEVGPFPNMGNPVRPNPASPDYNLNMRPDLGGGGGPFGSGNPFSGFMNGMSAQGGQPGAGLIPKFVNLLGRGMAGA